MKRPASNLAVIRRNGKTQVDAQRAAILDAAEKLFLQNGIPNTQMIDIAAGVGITKMSLYRYFPNRDAIALEIHKRMMNRIAQRMFPAESLVVVNLAAAREIARAMIHHFADLQDAYRYMGMFDALYLDNPSENELTRQTKQLLFPFLFNRISFESASLEPVESSRVIMVLSTVIWFLEKLALRGELTWSDQAVPLENHLKLFEEMILTYIDRNLSGTP